MKDRIISADCRLRGPLACCPSLKSSLASRDLKGNTCSLILSTSSSSPVGGPTSISAFSPKSFAIRNAGMSPIPRSRFCPLGNWKNGFRTAPMRNSHPLWTPRLIWLQPLLRRMAWVQVASAETSGFLIQASTL